MPSTSPLGSQELAPFPALKGLPPVTGSSVPSPFYRHSDYYMEYQLEREAASTSQNYLSSMSSGSFEEDGDGNATRPIGRMSKLPKDLDTIYETLVPVLASDHAVLVKLVSATLLARATNRTSRLTLPSQSHPCAPKQDIPRLEQILKQTNAFLGEVVCAGLSYQWTGYDDVTAFFRRISDIINAKKAPPPKRPREFDFKGVRGLEYAANSKWVAVKAEDWEETSVEGLYQNAKTTSVFSWDDVGAGSSAQPEQLEGLKYTQYPTTRSKKYPRTLDYCAYPE